MINYSLIVWDYNGTLLNDVHAALGSVNMILKKRHMSTIDLEAYYTYLDTPIIRFYEHLFDFTKTDFKEIISEFNENYFALDSLIHLSNGATAALEHFNALGAKQIVLSASMATDVKKGLADYGIDGYFDTVIGANNRLAEGKEKAAKKYFCSHNISPQDVMFIGDTLHDKQIADDIGCDCVMLSTGHQGRRLLEKTGACVIDSLYEII